MTPEPDALAELSAFFADAGNSLERQQLATASTEEWQRSQAYKVNHDGFVTKRGEAKCAECGATIRSGARVWSVNVQRGRGSGSCWWKCNECVPLTPEEVKMSTRVASLCRVSTADQSIENQRAAVSAWTKAQGFGEPTWFDEPDTSGAAKERPERDRLLAACRDGQFNVVVVTALDRVGRSAAEVILIIDELRRLNVRLVSLREGLDFQTTLGQMCASMLAFIAQLEREFIQARTKAAVTKNGDGATISRRSGRAWGRRPLEWDDAALLTQIRALAAAGDRSPAKTLAGTFKVRALRAVNEDGVPAFKSGKPRVRDEMVEMSPSEDAIRLRLKALGYSARGEKL